MTQPNWEENTKHAMKFLKECGDKECENCEKVLNALVISAIQQAREEVVTDLLDLCGELPIRIGMPRHLLAIDLHNYAKEKGISLTPNTEIQ